MEGEPCDEDRTEAEEEGARHARPPGTHGRREQCEREHPFQHAGAYSDRLERRIDADRGEQEGQEPGVAAAEKGLEPTPHERAQPGGAGAKKYARPRIT